MEIDLLFQNNLYLSTNMKTTAVNESMICILMNVGKNY